MRKLNVINLGTFQRGDSAVIPWSIARRGKHGRLIPKNLTGYKLALTISPFDYTSSPDDLIADEEGRSSAIGYNSSHTVINIDCDDPNQMHGLDPKKGRVLFVLKKQTMWLEPGKYWVDIVMENKESHRARTCAIGKMRVQGHPTNRLTTDSVDLTTEGD